MRAYRKLSALQLGLSIFGTIIFPIAQAGDTLSAGQRLNPGASITSLQGRYTLQLWNDGVLRLYRSDGKVRAELGRNALYADMQDDGNFVSYSSNKVPVFNTETWGNPGAILRIQEDGNLVMYSSSNYPLWNIGADPEWMEPQLGGDVVGRDLNITGLGALGHIGLYVTGERIVAAYQQPGNSLREETLAQFKVPGIPYWGTAKPPIPSGVTAPGCYLQYCYLSTQYQSFEMRMANIRAAYGARLVGATYTLSPSWRAPTWGNAYHPPVSGEFRCDKFVLWALWQPSYFQSTAERNRWRGFLENQLNSSVGLPRTAFDNLKNYR